MMAYMLLQNYILEHDAWFLFLQHVVKFIHIKVKGYILSSKKISCDQPIFQ
jgi:hypothetical protein